MGIRVTYEYKCDICGGDAWQKEMSEYTFWAGAPILQPRPMKYVGEHVVCSSCLWKAREPLREIFAKHREPV